MNMMQDPNHINQTAGDWIRNKMGADTSSSVFQRSEKWTERILFTGTIAYSAKSAFNLIKTESSFNKFFQTSRRFNPNSQMDTSQMGLYPTNRLQSGPDIKQMLKSVKNVIMKDKFNVQSLKEFKQLVNNLSKPGSKLSQNDLNKLRTLTNKFGGKIRVDLEGIKGSGVSPHVHVENLGNKIKSRHIWLKGDVQ